RLVGQLGAVNSPVGIGAVQEAEEASRRRVPELLFLEQGDGGLAGVVVEEPERVVTGAEPITGNRGALAWRGLAGEDPGRRGGEGHRREPGVAKPEVRRADALPCPPPQGGAQRGDVRDVFRARLLLRCG